jgi:site-specific DNA recombinase
MVKLPDGGFCAYLRKSRADLEAEARGEVNTYARNERMLWISRGEMES